MAAGVAVIVASVMRGSAETDETVGTVAAPHEFRTSRAAGAAAPDVTRTVRKLSEKRTCCDCRTATLAVEER